MNRDVRCCQQGEGIHHNRKNAHVTRAIAACSRKIKQLAILRTLGSMLGALTFYHGFGGLSHRVDMHTQRS
jgi:hypothetical protein